MILLCLSNWYFSVEIRPELQKNILKFGYGINYKYEGMLAHSFDRSYVVTKFIYQPWMTCNYHHLATIKIANI